LIDKLKAECDKLEQAARTEEAKLLNYTENKEKAENRLKEIGKSIDELQEQYENATKEVQALFVELKELLENAEE